jgi:predicted nucleic acid-binding protein
LRRSSNADYTLIFDSSSLIVLNELKFLDLFVSRIEKQSSINIIIPTTVLDEISKGGLTINSHSIQIINSYSDDLASIPENLGNGEKGVIILAESLKNTTSVIAITDDKKARGICEKRGITVMGTLGLIEFLKKHKILFREEAIDMLKRIPGTSLYITQSLLDEANNKFLTQII